MAVWFVEFEQSARIKLTFAMSKGVHPSTLAGSFYPADKTELSKMINAFLLSAEMPLFQGKPQILIVPHAGYVYSGQTAAYGYKALQDQNYERVIIIAPVHRNLFSGIALSNFDSWNTPLAKIELDKKFAQKLTDTADYLFFNPEVFYYENALEVQLPFLQTVLASVNIIPILLGQVSDKIIEQFAFDLLRFVDDQSLVVISSDLSHYPNYETANQVDRETIDAIVSGNVRAFAETIQEIMRRGIIGLDTYACGEKAIKIGLILADYLGIAKDWKLLKYMNSGDISGDKSQVVGYASILCTTERKNSLLFEDESQELFSIAQNSLGHFLKHKSLPNLDIIHKFLYRPMGVFVTLKDKNQPRGCIGFPEAIFPLYLAVQKAVIAAANDPRFAPVTLSELPDIEIEISILSPLRKISDVKKIVLGKHGVMIKQGVRSGLFLPQVAEKTGWNLEAFLGHLCRDKAGLNPDAWKDKETEIYLFEVQIVRCCT